MSLVIDTSYEECFTAFIDLLGFRDVMAGLDETARLRVLNFLRSLSALRGEFEVQSTPEQGGTRYMFKPTISSFSDNIVISYPIRQVSDAMGAELAPSAVLHNFTRLLTSIVSAALSIGFLIRGGATIGKLYHAGGVVFGEALVDAYEVESRVSIYPRVVASTSITRRESWMKVHNLSLWKGDDGLYSFDCFTTLLHQAVPPSKHGMEDLKAWYQNAATIINRNLVELEAKGRLSELSKWQWFARRFRAALERWPPEMHRAWGVQPEAIHF